MDREAAGVLLVEDNPRDAELIVRALGRRLGSTAVHVSPDGADALDLLFGRGVHGDRGEARLPQVIILDLKLPKLDGLEVLEALKADIRTRAVPVVVLTSSNQDADVRAAYARGANSYVVKPVDFDALIEALDRLGAYWLSVNQPPR